MNEDDEWALSRLLAEPELEECTALRATIDAITHRVLCVDQTGWRTLCGVHRLVVFANRACAVVGRSLEGFDPSTSDVDCMACVAFGG